MNKTRRRKQRARRKSSLAKVSVSYSLTSAGNWLDEFKPPLKLSLPIYPYRFTDNDGVIHEFKPDTDRDDAVREAPDQARD